MNMKENKEYRLYEAAGKIYTKEEFMNEEAFEFPMSRQYFPQSVIDYIWESFPIVEVDDIEKLDELREKLKYIYGGKNPSYSFIVEKF